MFQLMEHSAIHMFHTYQLSHEITTRLRKHLDIVTLGIINRMAVPMTSGQYSVIRHLSWVNIHLSGRSSGDLRAEGRARSVTSAASARHGEGAADGKRDVRARST